MDELTQMMMGYVWLIAKIVILFGTIGLVFEAFKMLYRKRKKQKRDQVLKGSGILDIDKFDGKTFETYLNVVFKERGYKVFQTSYTKDYGADLVVEKNGIKTVIQAKRYQTNVGIKGVQEVVAAIKHYQCDKAMVITNSHFTKAAVELAKSNQVELWDRELLVKELIEHNVKHAVTALENDPSITPIKSSLGNQTYDGEKRRNIGQDVSKESLYKQIKEWRYKRSITDNVKAHTLFSNKTIDDLVEKMPRTMEELRGVSGFGDIKCEKYGEELLAVIRPGK